MTIRSPIWDDLVRACGSEYVATLIVANWARNKSQQCDVPLLDSQAIDWVISGREPDQVAKDRRKGVRDKRSYIRDILSEVSDNDIVHSVISSLRISAKSSELCYVYAEGTDEYQRRRIRILCNLIWYHRE